MDYVKKIITEITKIRKYDNYTVFSNIVELITLINQKATYTILCQDSKIKDLDKKCSDLLAKYTSEQRNIIYTIYQLFLDDIMLNYDNNIYSDTLGKVFEQLGLTNKHRQQFFTPESVSKFMALINFDKVNSETVNEKPFYTVCDPCVGSGRLLLKSAEVLREKNVDVSSKVLFVARDIDRLMAMLTYIQLSHYACPAVIEFGDSLLNTVYESWITPVCALQWYKFYTFFNSTVSYNKDGERLSSLSKKVENKNNMPKSNTVKINQSDIVQTLLF